MQKEKSTHKRLTIEKPPKQTWKSLIGIWFILPVLIYLSLVCALYEITTALASRSSGRYQLGFGLWHLMVIFFELGMFVTFVGYKSMIRVFRIFFLVMGMLSISFGVGVIIWRIMTDIPATSLLSSEGIMEFKSWEDLLDSRVVNVAVDDLIVVVICICDSAKRQDGKEKKNLFFNFKLYCRWVLKCLGISILASLANIFWMDTIHICNLLKINSDLYYDYCHFIMPVVLVDSLIGVVLIIFGLLIFNNYKNNDADDFYEKPSNFTYEDDEYP